MFFSIIIIIIIITIIIIIIIIIIMIIMIIYRGLTSQRVMFNEALYSKRSIDK